MFWPTLPSILPAGSTNCCHGTGAHSRWQHTWLPEGRRGPHRMDTMHREPANIFGRGGVRRAAEKCRKTGDDADVIAAGFLGKPAHRHVFDETLAQSADCSRRDRRVHGRLLLVEGSHHVQSRPPARSIQTLHPKSCDAVTSSTNSRATGSFVVPDSGVKTYVDSVMCNRLAQLPAKKPGSPHQPAFCKPRTTSS